MPPLNTLQRSCIALAISQGISMPLQAATITVNTISDSLPDNQSTNTCTLRSAIESANTDTQVDGCTQGSGNDSIEFDLPNNSTITLTNELPIIDSVVTINGTGQDNLAISGDFNSYILTVENGGDLSLSSVSLINGLNFNGGAINVYSATLTINDSTLFNNSADRYGGAIYANSSTVTINNSTLSGNSATSVRGGAVFSSSGSTTITNSTIANNFASIGGGGISSISSTSEINNCNISDNVSYFDGGGVESLLGPLTINNSHFFDNLAVNSSGGGIFSDSISDTIIINNSIFSNNSASYGGGISSLGGTTTIISNNTLSNNSAVSGGGAINNSSSDSSVITNNTISGNSSISGNGGGISIVFFAELTINNNILSGNTATVGDEILLGPDTSNSQPSINNNLLGSSQSNDESAFYSFTPNNSNIIATSDGLNLPLNQIIEPLADNGGPTLTHALPNGSPAINAGENTNCPEADQRGEPRDDGACDIGAFEGNDEPETIFTIPLKNGKSVIFGL